MKAKKRTTLDAMFGGVEETEENFVDPAPEVTSKKTVEKPSKQAEKKGREGIKQQAVYLPEPVYEQLRKLAFEERKKMHDYYLEGLDKVFKEKGLKSIKELHCIQ